MQYRFMAQFGVKSGEPFEKFRRLLNKIIASAQSLSRSWAQQNRRFRTEEQANQHFSHIQNQEAIFWEGLADEDSIVPKVDECIEEIKKICRPILADKPSFMARLKQNAFNKKKGKNR